MSAFGFAWEACAPAFRPDGTFRDLYVLDTESGDWQRFLGWVRTTFAGSCFRIDGEPAPWPESAEEALTLRPRASPLLEVPIGEIPIYGYFFEHAAIELSLDPRDVQSQRALDDLVGFMVSLGELLRKDVILTEENAPDYARIRYVAASGALTFRDPFGR